MKEVRLNAGQVALVDEEDFDLVATSGPWYAHACLNTSYAVQNYQRGDGRRTIRRMHNFITGLPYVDHINGNGLDNRRANLRPATPSQNQANQRKRRDNTSGFRGVQWHPPGQKWRAVIRVKGRLISLGYYPVREEAARAYDAAAIEFFGPYARTNFPKDESA